MGNLQKTLDFARELQSYVDRDWRPETGRDCPGYSLKETALMNLMTDAAVSELGMSAYEDLAGNRYFINANALHPSAAIRMAGSHLDSVEQGGRYDGPTGVIAAMAGAYYINCNNDTPQQPIAIVIWRNEESPWLNQFAVGSKLATGALSADFVETATHKHDPDSSMHQLMNQGLRLNGDALIQKLRSEDNKLIDPSLIDGLLETHIEQGSVLEEHGRSLGLATSIRGNVRFPNMIHFHGQSGHSGTVPQDKRKDANLALGLFIAKTNDIFSKRKNSGSDIVWSYPETITLNPASSTISSHARLRPEVRSTDQSLLDMVRKDFEQVAAYIKTKTGVDVALNDINMQAPVKMCDRINNDLTHHANQRGISTMKMPSGAGHDVGVLVEAGVPGGLIFIRHGNEGASHRPDEILGLNEHDNPFQVGSDFANAVEMNKIWFHGAQASTKPSKIPFSDDLMRRGARIISAPQ